MSSTGDEEVVADNQSAQDAGGSVLADDELNDLRTRWDRLQMEFVEEPRESVKEADSLVADLTGRIVERFSAERARLERQWEGGDDVSTEDLRLTLTRYRDFFDRLLSTSAASQIGGEDDK